MNGQTTYDPEWRMRRGVVWAYGLGFFDRGRGCDADKGPFSLDSPHSQAWRQGWRDAGTARAALQAVTS